MSTGRARTATLLAVVVVLVAAACSGDADDPTARSSAPVTGATTTIARAETTTSSAPTTTLPAGPTTTLPTVAAVGDLAVLDTVVDDDGTLGVAAALSLFVVGYAPVTGIDPAPTPVADGTPVLRTLLGHLDQLSDEQRLAVLAITDQPGLPFGEVPDDPRMDAVKRTADFGRAIFGDLLDRELRPEVKLTIAALPYANPDGTKNFSSPGSFVTALPFAIADGTTYDECRIRVNTDAPVDAALGFDDPSFISSIAAGVFHCMQYGLVGPGADVPLWVMEGAAAYAGEQYIQGSPRSADWWARWIGEPLRPLERRTYDAAGFFNTLFGYVDNVFKYTDILLGDPDPASLIRRIERTGALDKWGTQYATDPSWGSAFAMGGYGAPATAAPAVGAELTVDGPPVTLGTSDVLLAGVGYRLEVPGDVLVVTTDPGDHGGLRFGDGTEATFESASQAYCLDPGACICPGAAPDQSSASDVASTALFVGVGPSPGGGPTLSARTLLQWCNEVLVPAPPAESIDPCMAERWTSVGYEAPDTPGIRQEVTGGEGAVLDLRADRTVLVDMNATTPVVFTAQDAAGTITTTSLEYRGAGTGTWSADQGVVAVSGVDTTSFTVRLRIETSAGGQLTDITLAGTDTRLAGFAGLLGSGRYVCSAAGMTLTHVTPDVGGQAGFTFTPG